MRYSREKLFVASILKAVCRDIRMFGRNFKRTSAT
jgi:hypothetical protein